MKEEKNTNPLTLCLPVSFYKKIHGMKTFFSTELIFLFFHLPLAPLRGFVFLVLFSFLLLFLLLSFSRQQTATLLLDWVLPAVRGRTASAQHCPCLGWGLPALTAGAAHITHTSHGITARVPGNTEGAPTSWLATNLNSWGCYALFCVYMNQNTVPSNERYEEGSSLPCT